MINYIEKGIGLVELLAENGVQIINGAVHYTPLTDEETQVLIDNYDPLTHSRSSALLRINEQAQVYIDSQIEDYPQFERETWEQQRQEAVAWTSDVTALTPTVDIVAGARGVNRIDLLTSIMSHVDSLRLLSATVAGKRQALLDQAWSETDYKVIDSINFEV